VESSESRVFVTIPEAQRRTGLGRRQFEKAIRRGDLGVFDIGDWPRVRWRDVLAWLDSTRRSAAE